jgi:drug/metabolite transporter (DMT)-like permease
VAIIYGLNYSIAKDVMPHYVQPSGFILIRVLGAVALFQLIGLGFKAEKVARKHWPRLALAAFFGVAANQLLFFEGLNLTTPINASVIMTTNPIIVLGLSALVLKVPIKPVRVIGIFLGLAGALLLITRAEGFGQLLTSGVSQGNLMVLLNAASYGAYLIVVKPLMAQYKALTVIKWIFTIGLFYVIPFGYSQFMAVNWSSLPLAISLEITYVIVCTTFLAYLLNVYALKTVASTTVSFYIYLQPLFAAAAAIALGKDSLSAIAVGAAALIFSGVYLVSFHRKNF